MDGAEQMSPTLFLLKPMSITDIWSSVGLFLLSIFSLLSSLLAYIKILINSQILCMKNYSCLNDDIFV